MNNSRRKLIGNIFADAAKYVLTVGVLGSILAEKFSSLLYVFTGLSFLILIVLAFYITPKD